MPVLSALDQSLVPSDGTPSGSIRETRELAGVRSSELLAEVFGLELAEASLA